MKNRTLITFSLAALATAACTVTGPADDGFENSHESLSTGRLFSDDEAGFTIYRSGQAKQTKQTSAATTATSLEDIDYAAYQQWWQARETNSPEYRKFKLWQEFENYLHWQQRQTTE